MSREITREYPDGLVRCSWPGNDELYVEYHDSEWGVPVVGDREVFERIALEGFQAGLSWITILKRREGFRSAFEGFEIDRVADFDKAKIEQLMQDPGIIRNRAKIEATIHNAGLIRDLQAAEISISELVWQHSPEPGRRMRLVEGFEWIVTSPESDRLSKELRKLGFKFVGSTTMFALMQATGLINDHAPSCFRREQLA